MDECEQLADDRNEREADNRRKEHGPDTARPERAHHEVSGNQEDGRHNQSDQGKLAPHALSPHRNARLIRETGMKLAKENTDNYSLT